jgi:hypothetical protein
MMNKLSSQKVLSLLVIFIIVVIIFNAFTPIACAADPPVTLADRPVTSVIIIVQVVDCNDKPIPNAFFAKWFIIDSLGPESPEWTYQPPEPEKHAKTNKNGLFGFKHDSKLFNPAYFSGKVYACGKEKRFRGKIKGPHLDPMALWNEMVGPPGDHLEAIKFLLETLTGLPLSILITAKLKIYYGFEKVKVDCNCKVGHVPVRPKIPSIEKREIPEKRKILSE